MPFQCIEPEKLYSRDPQLKKEDVEILQEWLKKQPHLPELLETQVMISLHSCYYRIEAAKMAIDSYYTVRSMAPETFSPLAPDVLKTVTSLLFSTVLPQKNPEGYGILMLKLLDIKPENFDCVNFVKFSIMTCTLYVHQYGVDNGAVVLFDMKGASLGHLARVNLTVVRHALQLLQEGVPVRIKGIHVMNAIPLADKFLALVKPFLKGELYNMIQFHPPNSETLYKSVPKECLPQEYGGQQPSFKTLTEKNLENILENYEFFKWHCSQLVDESKRIGKPKTASSVFGMEGTFKKLEID